MRKQKKQFPENFRSLAGFSAVVFSNTFATTVLSVQLSLYDRFFAHNGRVIAISCSDGTTATVDITVDTEGQDSVCVSVKAN